MNICSLCIHKVGYHHHVFERMALSAMIVFENFSVFHSIHPSIHPAVRPADIGGTRRDKEPHTLTFTPMNKSPKSLESPINLSPDGYLSAPSLEARVPGRTFKLHAERTRIKPW